MQRFLFRGHIYESVENIPPVVYHGSPHKFTQFKPNMDSYWFSDDPASAATQGEYVYSARLKIVNPYQWVQGDDEPDDKRFISKMHYEGYDACIAPSNIGKTDYIVYSVDQIQIISVKKYRLNELDEYVPAE